MRLTRRGWATLAVLALAVVLGWQFGARSLNAIAAPILVAVLLGTIQVRWAEKPTVEISDSNPGFPGEKRTLSVSVTGSGMGVVKIPMPDGVASQDTDATVTFPHTFERTVELAERGIYTIGPPTVHQRGPLGLVERRVDVSATSELVVYPSLYDEVRDGMLADLFADQLEAERQEFDRLREYVPGDPLKNVHWKSSAKHDEFLVMEFAPTERTQVVTIAAAADGGSADETARITATIADVALDFAFDVEIIIPEKQLPPGQGSAHKANLFRLLARVGPGVVTKDAFGEADVAIKDGPESTTVRIRDRTYRLDELLAGTTTPPMEVTG